MSEKPIVGKADRNKPVVKPPSRVGNPAMRDPAQLMSHEDNQKFADVNSALFNMPTIDMRDQAQVQERLNEYFALYTAYDMKPTVAGMAIALNGHSRKWLYNVVNDVPAPTARVANMPAPVRDVIKKAYAMLENLWETYMNNGKINPVSGIFLAKNNYGYQDKTEHVLTPTAPQENEYSVADIRERYLEAGQNTAENDN